MVLASSFGARFAIDFYYICGEAIAAIKETITYSISIYWNIERFETGNSLGVKTTGDENFYMIEAFFV